MSKFSRKILNTKKGATIILVTLLFIVVSLVVINGFGLPLVRDMRSAETLQRSSSSYYLAEAGIEDVYYRLKNNMQLVSPVSISMDGNSSEVSILDSGGKKEITAVSDIDSSVRKIRTDLATSVTGVDFFYGAQIGEGGVVMMNNSRIEGAGGTPGNVYSNGAIVGDSNTVITGDLTVATGISEDTMAGSTICNSDQVVGRENPYIDFAQSFIPSETKPLSKVSLYIKKVSTPSSIPVKIVNDNSGSPGSVTLASGTLDRSLVGASYGWVEVVFSSPVTVNAGTTYWIVLDAAQSSSKYWVWCKDSSGGYGNGSVKYAQNYSSGSWSESTGDLSFKTYLGAGISSVSNARVLGTVRANSIIDSFVGEDAYYQNISNSTVVGDSYPGSPDPVVLAMPISDSNISDWKDDALNGGVIEGDCPGSSGCSNTLGPVKINGNLSVASGSTLTIAGAVHVTGNFIPTNSSTIRCDASFGEDSCVIVVDGHVRSENNINFRGSGNPESYLLILSTIEGCLGGTQETYCAPGNSGVYIGDNATGAIFYATKSLISLSNNVTITSIVGYKIQLGNNAVIRYEVGVADLNFSSGPGGGWKISQWKEVE